MNIGSIVYLTEKPEAGRAVIDGFLRDIKGGVTLNKYLDGFRCWNVKDLTEADIPDIVKSTIVTDDGREWHLMKREGGSVCLYWTRPDDPAQYIVWDSLDNGATK